MKKILILSAAIFSILIAEAQTTKHPSKKIMKAHTTNEMRIQAHLDSLQAQRQVRIDSMVTGQLHSDSVRRLNDSLAYEKTQQDRMAWNENKSREIDSANKEYTKLLSKQQEQSLTIQQQRSAINKSAKLNEYQGQQVSFINQSFFGKAQKIKSDASLPEDQKKMELAKLNDERRARLKTIIGKSKEKKLEKALMSHSNSNDTEVQWIYDLQGYAKN